MLETVTETETGTRREHVRHGRLCLARSLSIGGGSYKPEAGPSWHAYSGTSSGSSESSGSVWYSSWSGTSGQS
jgi:hypothetical protein